MGLWEAMRGRVQPRRNDLDALFHVPSAAITNAALRTWPGLKPRVTAASGLTAATRMRRPSRVRRRLAWATSALPASAITSRMWMKPPSVYELTVYNGELVAAGTFSVADV